MGKKIMILFICSLLLSGCGQTKEAYDNMVLDVSPENEKEAGEEMQEAELEQSEVASGKYALQEKKTIYHGYKIENEASGYKELEDMFDRINELSK